MTGSAGKYKQISQFSILQAYRPLLAGWLDTYIRYRLFGTEYDPMEGELVGIIGSVPTHQSARSDHSSRS